MICGIIGSYATNTNIKCSDIDIAVFRYPRTIIKPKHFDLHYMPIDRFLLHIVDPNRTYSLHSYIQWIYPYYFCKTFKLASYFAFVRDDLIRALHPRIYDTFFRAAEEFRGKTICGDLGRQNKNIVRSILKYATIANYAAGMPFAQAHRPEGELHDFLISVRLGQVPLADAVARNELERTRAEKAVGFYKESVHPEVLQEFKEIMLKETVKE